jgi:hypothetical protein
MQSHGTGTYYRTFAEQEPVPDLDHDPTQKGIRYRSKKGLENKK